MERVTCYRVPPSNTDTPVVDDMTDAYYETITRSLSTIGRVSPTKFWRLQHMGDPRVFVGAQVPIKRVRASVALLWDYSGSQQGFEPQLRESLSVVGAALKRLDIDVWAGAYTSAEDGTGIFEVNGWYDRWDHKRVQTLQKVSMGNTPTGVSLSWLRRFVMPRAPRTRRLVLNCTDGGPGDPETVKQEVKMLRAMGCVVAALYVGGDHDSAIRSLENQYDRRYSFAATRREDIPTAFNQILGRLAHETLKR